jgi:hypothetical protein
MNAVAKWLVAAAMTGIGPAAMAQDTQFNYVGQFVGGGTINGALFINTATGALDSGSVLVAGLPTALAVLDGAYMPSGGPFFPQMNEMILLTNPTSPDAIFTQISGGVVLQATTGNGIRIGPATLTLIRYPGQPLCFSDCPTGVTYFAGLFGAGGGNTFGDPGVVPSETGGIALNFASGSSITPAPEIDVASATTGLTLLLGSLMVLRGRRSAVVAA